MGPTTNITLFNGNFGYLEAFVRAQRDRMLSAAEYTALTQCPKFSDLLLSLNTTSHSDITRELHAPTSKALNDALTKKLGREFADIRSHAEEPLSTFLDYVSSSYMIDNVILIILGTVNGRKSEQLLERCHPLGLFPGIGALTSCETVTELYDSLMESPLGRYFAATEIQEDPETASARLAEVNIEVIRSTLYKAYIEDFYEFCRGIGGNTFDTMKRLLMFDADRRTINIVLNALETELTRDEKMGILPDLGHLYPYWHDQLLAATDYDGVAAVVDQFDEYHAVFEAVATDSSKTLSDVFFSEEVELNRMCWFEQFNFGIFYSFLKLREQENRNIVWIADCILHDSKQLINQYAPVWI